MPRLRLATVSFVSLLGLSLGFGAGCFDDPASEGDNCTSGEEDCACLANSTCFGNLECVQGVCLVSADETSGDGDGDPTGDGDGEPEEVVVLDMFSEACGITASWSSLLATESTIPCDQAGDAINGWMERFIELEIGPQTLPRVISLVTAPAVDSEIRGRYNVDDVPNLTSLEFRAEVALRCPMGELECSARFNLAFAEGVSNLYAVFEDRDLQGFSAPVPLTVSLASLVTFSQPTVVLSAQRTDASLAPSPELLIINPRLVMPDDAP